MKSSELNIYKIICKILLFAGIFLTLISCSNYRYVTQNYNATIIIDSVQAAEMSAENKIEYDSSGIYIVKTFSKENILIANEKFFDNKKNKKIEDSKYYFPDGKLKFTMNYDKEGKRDGKLLSFYLNGKTKREDFYKLDSLISGKCYDSLGNEVKYFNYFESTTINLQILQSCLKYPENLRRQNIEELVILKILLDKKGKIIKIKYDELNSMEFVNVGARCILNYNLNPVKVDGEPIIYWVSIPIHFRLR